MYIWIHQVTRKMASDVDLFIYLMAASLSYAGEPDEKELTKRLQAQWDFWAELDDEALRGE